jgi:hypothetical protein
MPDPINHKSSEAIRWAPAGSPVQVEYTLGLMAQIRDHVIVGFHRLAKRGIECGGVLYGRREGNRVFIEQIREIRCEYKLGPSFVLSDSDRLRLSQQLQEPEPELAGLVAVGLYVSHTKDDLRATERDLTVYDSYFPNPWQVLLVLRPARQGSVRAGFFVREPGGRLHSDKSYEEFELDPPDSPAEAAALMAAARVAMDSGVGPNAGSSHAGAFASGRGGAAAAPAMAQLQFTPEFGGQPFAAAAESPQPRQPEDPGRALIYPGGARNGRALSPALQVSESVDSLHQRFQQYGHPSIQQRGGKHWTWLGAWAIGILALVAAGYLLLSMRSPAPLLLRVAAQNGDLRIEWDRASATIQRSGSGKLEIRDANGNRDLVLSPEQLATGSYLFPIAGGDVSIRLSVDGLLIPRVEESVNFVAQAKTGGDAGRLTQENRGLRDDLSRQRQINERLEQRLRLLEERLQASPPPATPTRNRRKKPTPQQTPNPE